MSWHQADEAAVFRHSDARVIGCLHGKRDVVDAARLVAQRARADGQREHLAARNVHGIADTVENEARDPGNRQPEAPRCVALVDQFERVDILDHAVGQLSVERVAVAEKIIERATKAGIPIEDIVLDPLAMTMGADHKAGWVTLETIKIVAREFGVNLTMGASNISFGLPDRKYVNAAFIAMAIQAGLTCPITNPLVTEVNTAILAADLALGKDEFCSLQCGI